MSILEIILLSIGLAIDASCLCTVIGLVNKPTISKTLSFSLPFGILQGIMPMIGYFSVGFLPVYFFNYDHLIAFALLEILGFKMIYDVVTDNESDEVSNMTTITFGALLIQGISTSIDALAVGVTLHGESVISMVRQSLLYLSLHT